MLEEAKGDVDWPESLAELAGDSGSAERNWAAWGRVWGRGLRENGGESEAIK